MTTIEEFVALIDSELGLAVTAADVHRDFDQVAGWDSVLLLSLLTALERETGRPVPFADVLEARNLAGIYALVSVPA